MSSSSEVTEFNAVEKLSLPAEGVVQVNSNLVAVDNNNANSIVTDSIQEPGAPNVNFRKISVRKTI